MKIIWFYFTRLISGSVVIKVTKENYRKMTFQMIFE